MSEKVRQLGKNNNWLFLSIEQAICLRDALVDDINYSRNSDNCTTIIVSYPKDEKYDLPTLKKDQEMRSMLKNQAQVFSLSTIKKYLCNSMEIKFELTEWPEDVSNHDKLINKLNVDLYATQQELGHSRRQVYDLYYILNALIDYINAVLIEGKKGDQEMNEEKSMTVSELKEHLNQLKDDVIIKISLEGSNSTFLLDIIGVQAKIISDSVEFEIMCKHKSLGELK